jgi:seryl-tRNA synthetase
MKCNNYEKNYKKNFEPKNEQKVNQTAEPAYAFYSRLLSKPFDSVEELTKAEAAYNAEQKAKEDKAAQKKADAKLVEEAFKALNAARKLYKESLINLTDKYSKDLKVVRDKFEADKKELQTVMATAEDTYAKALKAFTDKYDTYHLSLKDGDFETTISGSHKANVNPANKTESVLDLFDWFFNF